jgi:hypothetical protein
MSADQQTLDSATSETALPAHLTKHASKISNTSLRAAELKSRECWCVECNARVTRSKDLSKEYGHGPNCKHKIGRSEGSV